MFASSEDAILLFDKWRTEGTGVLCIAVSVGWHCSFKGRITLRTGNAFELSSPNGGTGVLIVSLDVEGIRFEYADSSEIPSLGKDACGLIIEMPLRFSLTGVSSADRLTFMELPSST